MNIYEKIALRRKEASISVEISMLNVIECLVYLPEQDADQIIDRMKQTVKQIREEREVKHDEV